MKGTAVVAVFTLATLGITGCGSGSQAVGGARSAPTATTTIRVTSTIAEPAPETSTATATVRVFTKGPVTGSEPRDEMLAKMVHNVLPVTLGDGSVDPTVADRGVPGSGLSDEDIQDIAEYDCSMLPSHTLKQAYKVHAEEAKLYDPAIPWTKDQSQKFLIAAAFAKCPGVSWIGKTSTP